ncbi:MAG: NADH:ubiquinone oxidoreductase subunit NDUFA12 [Paracoccaceae bacterium]
MSFLLRLLTWWNRETFGTQLFTWRKGLLVGTDDHGNRFFQTRDGKRRWVLYNGNIEASRVSPEWHGWLHHTFSDHPGETPLARKPWEKPHQANLTGSDAAYAPAGSLRASEPVRRSDYEAWQPE